MTDDMVMRSVYLRPLEDNQLRQLAHELNVTKSDLIRTAISVKLLEWLQSNDRNHILAELAHGKRDEAAIRSGPKGRDRSGAAAARHRGDGGSASPSRGRKSAEKASEADSPQRARDALV